MQNFYFHYFMDYPAGKIARFNTMDEYQIPINILIDNVDEFEGAEPGPCRVDVYGVSYDIKFFGTEEEYRASGNKMAPVSMIPMGTFPGDPAKGQVAQSPHIMFSGKVLAVGRNPDAGEDETNFAAVIETVGVTFTLYLRYDGPAKAGDIASGVAVLMGRMER